MLSAAALRAVNQVYRDIRLWTRECGVPFLPYSTALKRAQHHAVQLNGLAEAGTLQRQPQTFWITIFGEPASSSARRTIREVEQVLHEHDAAPERCQGCGRLGPVTVDANDDGTARGWLCQGCRSILAACRDAAVLSKLARYVEGAHP